MKKRKWLLLMPLIIIAAVFASIQTPSEADFASWMEETYEVQCLDELCDVFQLETVNEKIVMQSVQGGFSPGIFIARMNKTYRNHEDPSYHLEIKARGFLGNITIEKETMQGMRKR
ncbi:hypothetical protein M3172_24565 [Mesobacillus subterraneus]|uniref:hypothetical protein n=1 Tax=Mesobacillus subterraneus TaxID=285983 RepID=UPI00203F96BF|nr:hypothetical protein [Mesobacillus subterraneus]MCM3576344.1 hypothetical protein [Mesobacillus subterraneus]